MTTTLARDASRDRNPSDQPERGGLPGIWVEESTRQLGRRAARLVLDPHFVLDEVIARLIRGELARGGTVQVVLVLPRLRWSLAAVAVVARRGRIDQVRKERIVELLRIAGDRSAQVTIRTQRSWCRQPPERALSS
ncbi:hypothetical protein NSZ01_28240 [Nocardioides szechwanensis]|nr:hypothetical protein NSZ01_28240 [Nocardioides szechwanensis]